VKWLIRVFPAHFHDFGSIRRSAAQPALRWTASAIEASSPDEHATARANRVTQTIAPHPIFPPSSSCTCRYCNLLRTVVILRINDPRTARFLAVARKGLCFAATC
jgi:hypothetical protein